MSSQAEGRWADALAVLHGGADQALLRRTRRRAVVAVSVTIVVAVAAGVVGALLSTHSHAHTGRHRPAMLLWRDILGYGLLVVGIVLVSVPGVRLLRSAQIRAGWRAPTRVLSGPQQRQLLAQLRGKAPVEPARLPLLRDLAGRMQGQRHLQRVCAGLAVLMTGNAIITDNGWTRLIVVPAVVVLACAAAAMRRDIALAGAFLARHPAEPAPGSHLK